MQCERCQSNKHASSTMSMFEPKMICPDCENEERQAPHYEAARAVELRVTQAGNLHFQGVWEVEPSAEYPVEFQREDRKFTFEKWTNRPGIVFAPPRKR